MLLLSLNSQIIEYYTNTPTFQFSIVIAKEESFILLKDKYNELVFKVTHNAGNHDAYVFADDKYFAILDPIALFIEYIFKEESWKN